MAHESDYEDESARLVALRSEDPNGEIDSDRMARGFDVAEARTEARDGAAAARAFRQELARRRVGQ